MHVRRALALTLAVPVLLAGCSDDEPAPTPKIPEPTSSSPTPTEAATEEPEAESPEEFIRRWVEAGDEMQVTGETSEYLALTTPECKACKTFAGAVEDAYRDGGSIEFAGAKINGIVRTDRNPPSFELTKTLPKTVIRAGGSGQPETLPAGKTTLLVILARKSGKWAVNYYGVL